MWAAGDLLRHRRETERIQRLCDCIERCCVRARENPHQISKCHKFSLSSPREQHSPRRVNYSAPGARNLSSRQPPCCYRKEHASWARPPPPPPPPRAVLLSPSPLCFW